MSENEIQTSSTVQKIHEMTGYSYNEIALVKNTIAKGTTDIELGYFLNIAKSTGLNPFMKELWCYKDGKGNLLVFAGRDGFLKKAQESNLWNGMTSAEVCMNDEFEMDVPSATIKHKPNFKDRGAIIGAYAIVKPKGCEYPTVEFVDMKTYDKGFNAWKSHAAEMIKKVAETHALKKAFGITGLQSEYDFQVKDNIVVELQGAKSTIEQMQEKIIDALEKYNGLDRDTIREMCVAKRKAGEFTEEFARSVAEMIGFEL